MRLNLNVSDQTKAMMKKTCDQYKVSMSTLVDILFNQMVHDQIIPQTYFLDDSEKKQTTIIINKANTEVLMKTNITCYYCFFSNLVWCWYHWDKVNADEKTKNDIKSRIINELKNRKERYWDYNNQYRNMYRARKQYEREKAKKEANM